jgi:hypothetical protein
MLSGASKVANKKSVYALVGLILKVLIKTNVSLTLIVTVQLYNNDCG